MDIFRACSICGGYFHNVSRCSDPRIHQTWNYIFYIINLRSPDAMEYLDDARTFLETDVSSNIITAIGIQYANSDNSNSREDHITYILNRVRVEIEMVNELSFDMREEYLQREYPSVRDDDMVLQHNINIQQYSLDHKKQDIECPICLEDTEFSMVNQTNCEHKFCHTCLLNHMKTKTNCPLCRTEITTIDVKSVGQCDDMNIACRRIYDDDDVPDLIDVDEDNDEETMTLEEFLIQEQRLFVID